MIVLVDARQQKLLDKLAEEDDRFQRELEQIGETAPAVAVVGVPEPHEWLLIGLALSMLVWLLKENSWTRSLAFNKD
jgi:hypothetical protein